MKQKITSLILIVLLISFNTYAQNKADDITGIWLTNGKEPAKIQVFSRRCWSSQRKQNAVAVCSR